VASVFFSNFADTPDYRDITNEIALIWKHCYKAWIDWNQALSMVILFKQRISPVAIALSNDFELFMISDTNALSSFAPSGFCHLWMTSVSSTRCEKVHNLLIQFLLWYFLTSITQIMTVSIYSFFNCSSFIFLDYARLLSLVLSIRHDYFLILSSSWSFNTYDIAPLPYIWFHHVESFPFRRQYHNVSSK
jgi:hypothetical protein